MQEQLAPILRAGVPPLGGFSAMAGQSRNSDEWLRATSPEETMISHL
jgi:hypothetical protein